MGRLSQLYIDQAGSTKHFESTEPEHSIHATESACDVALVSWVQAARVGLDMELRISGQTESLLLSKDINFLITQTHYHFGRWSFTSVLSIRQVNMSQAQVGIAR